MPPYFKFPSTTTTVIWNNGYKAYASRACILSLSLALLDKISKFILISAVANNCKNNNNNNNRTNNTKTTATKMTIKLISI